LDLPYIVGVQSTLTVWPPGQRPLPSKPWNGHGRKPSRLNRDLEHQPVTVKELALSLKKKAWRTLTWREGSNTPLTSRFAAVRLRPASRDYNRTKPHPVEWLIVEWPNGEAEPRKYWLSTLPKDTPLQDLDDCGPCVVVIGSRPGLLFCRTAGLCLIVTGTEGQPPSLSGKLDAPPVSSPIAFRRRQLDRAFRRHRLFRQIKQDGSSSGSNGITRNGSWLDMAESELTVLASQCLDRRIPDFYESNPEALGISPNRGRAHSKSMRFKSSISSDNVPSAVTSP
jgi:hypothetical protein